MRPNVVALTVNPLPLELGHPSTPLLAFSREEVGIEHGQIRSVTVENFVSLDVGMVNGDVVVGLEGDAIQAIGQSEHAIDNLREFEIRAQHFAIEVVFLHLQLVRIVRRVPRF